MFSLPAENPLLKNIVLKVKSFSLVLFISSTTKSTCLQHSVENSYIYNQYLPSLKIFESFLTE